MRSKPVNLAPLPPPIQTSSRPPVFLLALGAGATIANLYYSQPILPRIAADFHLPGPAAGYVTVAAQAGYAAGLLFIVPLGDVVERRTLIMSSIFGAGAMLLAAAAAPTLPVLIGLSVLLGFFSISPQLLIPFAATLAAPEQRGRIVGTVTAGLLAGILTGRLAGGFVGSSIGWRPLYVAAGVGMGLLGVAIWLCLPRQIAASPSKLRDLPSSVVTLFLREAELRRHLLMGAAAFAAFSAFWTSLTFYLASRPNPLGGKIAGLFGLLGIAGVVTAPLAGRLADRLPARTLNGASLGLVSVSFIPMAFAAYSLVWLVLGAVLMEVGVQCNLVASQSRLHALAPEARSRINALYMAGYFAGGATGSALGPWCLKLAGWPILCAVACALALVGLVTLPSSASAPTQATGELVLIK